MDDEALKLRFKGIEKDIEGASERHHKNMNRISKEFTEKVYLIDKDKDLLSSRVKILEHDNIAKEKDIEHIIETLKAFERDLQNTLQDIKRLHIQLATIAGGAAVIWFLFKRFVT